MATKKLTQIQIKIAKELLIKAQHTQSLFWSDLRQLERLVGFEIDATQDLEETNLDVILANPGAQV